jgi:hypothetical protein
VTQHDLVRVSVAEETMAELRAITEELHKRLVQDELEDEAVGIRKRREGRRTHVACVNRLDSSMAP